VGVEAMIENYRIIRHELESWSETMREKEELIVLSKCELVDTEMLEEMRVEFETSTEKKVDLIISA
jgi:GTPase involved in cell partitioning and DNA repair